MELLTHCPSCDNRFHIAKDVLHYEPQYQCPSCRSHFRLKVDQSMHQQIQSMDSPSVESLVIDSEFSQSAFKKSCVKCGHENRVQVSECEKCGVVLEKALKSDEILSGTSLALKQLWQQVLNEYDNEELHERFISYCEKQNALLFASNKYGSLVAANPADEIATKMRDQLLNLIMAEPLKKPMSHMEKKWWGLVTLSCGIIFFGLFAGHRLVLLGTVLLMIVVGVRRKVRFY